MASLNRVFLIGNLTRDPEVRHAPSGKAVADMRMAINRRFRTSTGEDRDETCYVNVVVWDRQAENCKKYLSKGSPLFVEGRLQYEEWEKDGQKNSRLRVVADRVQFLGPPRRLEFEDGTAAPGVTGVEANRETAAPDVAPPPPAPEDGSDAENLPF